MVVPGRPAMSAPQVADGSAPSDAQKPRLIVGTKVAPPFSMKGADGAWKGISIDLWNRVAARIGVQTEFREFDLKGLLKATETGAIDVGIAAITLTPARESVLDFSHSFYYTGLGIAVPASPESGILDAVKGIFTLQFLGAIGGLLALLFLVGVIIWFFERRANPEEFPPGAHGIWDGLWWSAVTMTTVGYGDKSPRSKAGRLVGLIWMFAGIIIISFFTAGIASSLTVNRLESSINGPEDLPGLRVGSIEKSSSAAYLLAHDITPNYYDSVEEGLGAVASGQADAFVYDRPIMQYQVKKQFANTVIVLDTVFDPQSYGIALPTGSKLREEINTALLAEQTDHQQWEAIKRRYLGN